MYNRHCSLISSDSFTIAPALTFISIFVFIHFFFQVNFATLSYTKSDLPFLSSSSNSLHSLLHHVSFALAASLLSSLFSSLYRFFPSSLLSFFHFRLSSILLIVSSVIQGFLGFRFP